jgi:voltage-gated potassium channel
MGNFLAKKLLIFAYRLDTSVGYGAAKSFFRNLLLNESFRYKKYFDYSMITLVLVTVGIYLYDIKNETGFWLTLIEVCAILVFCIEYFLRFWVHSDMHKIIIARISEWEELRVRPRWWKLFLELFKNKLMFVLQPMSIVDLLSIHPGLRPLRLFKIFRYSEITRGLFSILATKKYEFGVLFVLITMTVFIASSLFYVFEADNPEVNTYFDAVYWSVITIATVGYGDVVPSTTESKIESIFLVFAGLGVLAMLTSLVTTTLGQRISVVREQRGREYIGKLKEYILVCGFGKMGDELCLRLHESKIDFVVVDIEQGRIDHAKALGYKAFLADASKVETLKALEVVQKASFVICLTKSDIVNISIILAVRSMSKTIKIISKANEAKNEDKMLFAGANEIIGLGLGAQVLAEFLNSPVSYQAVYELIADDKHVLAEELLVEYARDDLLLSSLEVRHFGCLVLGVIRKDGEFLFNPKENVRLYQGDRFVVIGRPKRIEGLHLRLLKGGSDA